MDPGTLAARLHEEARRTDQRRLLVLAGDREATYAAARDAIEGAGVDPATTTLVGDRDVLETERIPPERAGDLLGTTRDAVVVDAHDRLVPNALGRVVGAVDGGGLLVLLAPPLDSWPDRTDGFDDRLAVPPHGPDEVTGNFRRRVVDTLRSHPGVAILDVDGGTVERDGLTDQPGRARDSKPGEQDPAPEDSDADPASPDPPEDATFPSATYRAARTRDQRDAVAELELLRPGDGRHAVVLEADRGRGKSSAVGLAAGALAADGADVLVTAPGFRSAREVFARADELLTTLGAREGTGKGDGSGEGDGARKGDENGSGSSDDPSRSIETAAGGRLRYLPPAEATAVAGDADVVVVDEAAALPVRTLAATLAADRVAYATTVHGYEGTGRGFSVRFRDRLAESDHEVLDLRIDEPIRYARDDPVESWAFRALLLDARPPVADLVADASPDSMEYRRLDPAELIEDEYLLRETFGLLVLAHYRTEPDDLARLLDAPNVSVRALLHDGRVVSVALLAREGGLSEKWRQRLYEGARIRGHMLPDVLTSQLRDEDAGIPVGWRVLRIATHHAARSRGLGTHLLERIREEAEGEGENDPEAGSEYDWLGVGYGATPQLLRFWRSNGYGAVHLSVTRNDRSGEHSALMLHPLTDAGRNLHDRHARWFLDRLPGALSDPLSGVDPDVVRETLVSIDAPADPGLTDREWRVVASAAYGPGLFEADPGPFRRLVVAGGARGGGDLTDREERLLVLAILQGRPIEGVADDLGYHSTGQCLRAVGDALASLCDRFGGDAVRVERDRYRE